MYSDVETCIIDDRKSKKTNKPLMEKKRRARINHCLTELKEILIVDKHASAGHAKWEKADILEMTVEYMKKLRTARGLPMIPMPHTSISLDDPSDSRTSQHISPAPSTTSSVDTTPGEAASSVVQHPFAKRRRTVTDVPVTSVPSTSVPVSINVPTIVNPTIPHAPTPLMPNFAQNFLTSQIIAFQQHQMKMGSMAPQGYPTVPSLPTPVPLHLAQFPHYPISTWRAVQSQNSDLFK